MSAASLRPSVLGMKVLRRIRLWALPFAVAVGAFALPFGTVTACDEKMTVSGIQLVSGSPPASHSIKDNSPSANRDVGQVVVAVGGGLALGAFACALSAFGLAFARGRRAASVAAGAGAIGATALLQLALRGRADADAFDLRLGLVLAGGASVVGALGAATGAVRGWKRRRPSTGVVLAASGTVLLAVGTILSFVREGYEGSSTGDSLLDFLAPGIGHGAAWLGLEPALLVLVATAVLAAAPRWRSLGGFLAGLGAVSLTGHMAMIVNLLRRPENDDGRHYLFATGGAVLLAGSLVLLIGGLLLARGEAGSHGPLGRLTRLGLLAGAGLSLAACFLPFRDDPHEIPLHLHDIPSPVAYGAAPILAAALALLAVLLSRPGGPFVRGLLLAAGVESLLIFLGLLSVLSPNDGSADPGTGLYLGIAGGVVLFCSGLAAGLAKPRPAAIR